MEDCQSSSSSPSACETLARRSRETSGDVGIPEGAGPRGRRVAAAVPGDDGEPRPAVGVRPQDLCHPLRPARHDGCRLRLRRQSARHLLVLRLLQRRDRALHLPPHPTLHRAVPSALLPPEASSQSAAARPLHRRHQLCCRHDMRLHQRKSHFGGCNSYSSGGDQLNCLHFLGCKEGPRFRVPWFLPVCCSHGAHGVFTDPDLFPTWQDLCDDLWWTGGAYLQWLHHLRHGQYHQALHL